MSDQISIQFTRFSAFYSPLIATPAGGFLQAEGLTPMMSNAEPGQSAIAGLLDGSVHVAQSAPSQGFWSLEKGEKPPVVHFAQINERDGFFLLAREADDAFSWSKLAGQPVIIDHGGQPNAMFRYACHKSGLDYASIEALDKGNTAEMIAAFKAGEGRYIHLQGPAPQQLAHEGHGFIVAALGDPIGPCAFSSLAATREWLSTDMAAAFMRAYRKARNWLLETPASEVAKAEKDFFPDVDQQVLAETIATYQKLGNWTPHVEITREAFNASVDIFTHAGLITKRHAYEDIIAPPPAG